MAVSRYTQDLRLCDKADNAITKLDMDNYTAEARYKQEVPLLQAELGTNNEEIEKLQQASRAPERKIIELRNIYHATKKKRYDAEQSFRRSCESYAADGPIYTVLISLVPRTTDEN